MKIIHTLFAVGALIAVAGCAGPDKEVRVQSTATNDVVAHAKTYAIGSSEQAPPKYRSSPRSADIAKKIRPLLEDALRAKGYAAAATVGEADLVWMYAAGRREVEKHPMPSNRESGESYSDPNEEFEEGAVVLDALDKSGAVAWHGFGRTEIDPNKVDDAQLKRVVDQIMARFPNVKP